MPDAKETPAASAIVLDGRDTVTIQSPPLQETWIDGLRGEVRERSLVGRPVRISVLNADGVVTLSAAATEPRPSVYEVTFSRAKVRAAVHGRTQVQVRVEIPGLLELTRTVDVVRVDEVAQTER